MNYLS